MSGEQLATTEEGLEKALGDLVKAVGVDNVLNKAGGNQVNVESSGTVGSDGPQGGGIGTYPGDVEIDTLMIGKLGELGFSTAQISAMTGALKKEAGEGEDEEEPDEDDVEVAVGKMRAYAAQNGGKIKGYPPFDKSAPSTSGGEPLTKAMEAFQGDPEIADGINALPFLEAFVEKTAGHLDNINASLAKSNANQGAVNKQLATALYHLGNLTKSQALTIQRMGERLGVVERQPMPQRGVTTAAALHKSMPGEVGARGALSKSEVMSTLSYMNLQKGIKQINGRPTAEAVALLESGGQIGQDVLRAVEQFHAQNPNESTVARTF